MLIPRAAPSARQAATRTRLGDCASKSTLFPTATRPFTFPISAPNKTTKPAPFHKKSYSFSNYNLKD